MSNNNFNMVRATFYLVAAVFGVYSLAALSGVVACTLSATPSDFCGSGKLSEAFATLLASALAFSAGHATGGNKE